MEIWGAPVLRSRRETGFSEREAWEGIMRPRFAPTFAPTDGIKVSPGHWPPTGR